MVGVYHRSLQNLNEETPKKSTASRFTRLRVCVQLFNPLSHLFELNLYHSEIRIIYTVS